VRQLRLPKVANRSLLSLRGDTGIGDPNSATGNAAISPRLLSMARTHGLHMDYTWTTKAAERYSPQHVRHGSHAIDGEAMLPEVRATSATTTSPQ
jgi:hypothetical protein